MNVTIENTNNGGSQAVSLHANGDRQFSFIVESADISTLSSIISGPAVI